MLCIRSCCNEVERWLTNFPIPTPKDQETAALRELRAYMTAALTAVRTAARKDLPMAALRENRACMMAALTVVPTTKVPATAVRPVVPVMTAARTGEPNRAQTVMPG